MASETSKIVRQWDFSGGPNYTDALYTLGPTELAESDNVLLETGLKVIPGAAPIVAGAMTGTPTITGLYGFARANGNKYLVAASSNGRIHYENSGVWTTIATSLVTGVSVFWDWATFNNTLVGVSGSNVAKKWGATGNVSNVGGSPPQSKHISVQGDYVFLAGHTSNPSQIRYSDTSVLDTWPIGNVLNIGIDDNQIITGLQKLGDVTIAFKDRSVWQISGSTPTTFTIAPTLSEVGCLSPNTVVLTDLGIFYWSEAGPTLFNGFKSILLGRRLKTLLETVDWQNVRKFSAAYYPYKKQVLMSYQRTGQSAPDRTLLIDLYRSIQAQPTVIWPVLYGFTAAAPAEDTLGRMRAYLGTTGGHVLAWDSGTTWNGATIVGRARTRPLHLGHHDHVLGVRTLDCTVKSTSGNFIVRYGTDLATSMTTHTDTPTSMSQSGKGMKFIRLQGDGNRNLIVGRSVQFEFVNQTTGFSLYGYEVGFEPLSRRDDT